MEKSSDQKLIEGVILEPVNPKNSKPIVNYERQKRIDKIQELYCMSYSPNQIFLRLQQEQYIDPTTGKAITLNSIKTDLRHLHNEWMGEIKLGHSHAKIKHAQELRLLRRKAWERNQLYVVAQSLSQEAQVLGLNQTSEHDLYEGTNEEVVYFDFDSLSKEEQLEIGKSLEKVLLPK